MFNFGSSFPWYKTYPGTDLSSSAFYGLGAAERGLLLSMERAYWIEGWVPADVRLLARLVRMDEAEVRLALTTGVLSHFAPDAQDDARLHHVALRHQRETTLELRDRMSSGGKRGAARRNERRERRVADDAVVLSQENSDATSNQPRNAAGPGPGSAAGSPAGGASSALAGRVPAPPSGTARGTTSTATSKSSSLTHGRSSVGRREDLPVAASSSGIAEWVADYAAAEGS